MWNSVVKSCFWSAKIKWKQENYGTGKKPGKGQSNETKSCSLKIGAVEPVEFFFLPMSLSSLVFLKKFVWNVLKSVQNLIIITMKQEQNASVPWPRANNEVLKWLVWIRKGKGRHSNWKQEDIPIRKRKIFQLEKGKYIPIRKRKIHSNQKKEYFLIIMISFFYLEYFPFSNWNIFLFLIGMIYFFWLEYFPWSIWNIFLFLIGIFSFFSLEYFSFSNWNILFTFLFGIVDFY